MGRRAPAMRGWGIVALNFGLSMMLATAPAVASKVEEAGVNNALVSLCDAGVLLTSPERTELLHQLRISTAGTKIIKSFLTQYHSLRNLVLQWDSISYSQVAGGASCEKRGASDGLQEGRLGCGICVHLSRKLPGLEHVADLAHELTHATRLDADVLRGKGKNLDDFVRERLEGAGGEADAFVSECTVKRELLGDWDSFCAPYVSSNRMDFDLVLAALYNGRLAASLTGESYPIMLSRQFRALGRAPASEAAYSGLENTKKVH